VTDEVTGCFSVETFEIVEDVVKPEIDIISASTILDCDVSSIDLEAMVSNDEGNLSYLWNTGESTSIIQIGASGQYTIVVTDQNNNCTSSATIVIEQDDDIPSAVIQSNVTQLDCNNEMITLDASGSTGQNDLAFSWSDGSAGESISVSDSGTYQVIVTDAINGCTSVQNVVITKDFEKPLFELTSPDLLTCEVPSITLSAIESTPSDNYVYEWSTGATTPMIQANTPMDYSLTITDAGNGCVEVKSVSVEQDISQPTLVLDTPDELFIDCTIPSITLDASSSSSNNGVVYSWSDGSTSPSISVTEAGEYAVTITDAISGCPMSEMVVVEKDPSGDILVSVNITFDDHPSETSWFISDEQISEEDPPIIRDSGSNYMDGEDDFTSQTFDVCLMEGCYDFIISDSEGNGLSGGTFSVTTAFGDTIVTDTGFSSFINGFKFCVEEQTFVASIASNSHF